jgi:hypothetical protein
LKVQRHLIELTNHDDDVIEETEKQRIDWTLSGASWPVQGVPLSIQFRVLLNNEK